jgi:hypothetical protein
MKRILHNPVTVNADRKFLYIFIDSLINTVFSDKKKAPAKAGRGTKHQCRIRRQEQLQT